VLFITWDYPVATIKIRISVVQKFTEHRTLMGSPNIRTINHTMFESSKISTWGMAEIPYGKFLQTLPNTRIELGTHYHREQCTFEIKYLQPFLFILWLSEILDKKSVWNERKLQTRLLWKKVWKIKTTFEIIWQERTHSVIFCSKCDSCRKENCATESTLRHRVI